VKFHERRRRTARSVRRRPGKGEGAIRRERSQDDGARCMHLIRLWATIARDGPTARLTSQFMKIATAATRDEEGGGNARRDKW